MKKIPVLFSFSLLFIINFDGCYTSRNIPPRNVPPSVDAQSLHEAMVGIGTNEDKIIEVIGGQVNAERQNVIKEYYKLYNKDLVTDLKNELSGNLLETVKALLREPDVYLAKEIKKALTGVLTDDNSLAEILCTRTRNELIPIMNAYQKRYNKTLLSQLDESLEGDKRTFYKQIITEKIRDRGGNIDRAAAQAQVDLIPNTSDYCTIGQNHGLMNLFAKETFEHINFVAVFHEQAKGGKKIEDQLKRWCNNDGLTQAYQTVVRYAKDPIQYYADELHKAMLGVTIEGSEYNPAVNIDLGTNDNKLIRIIVSRSEIDLFQIKQKFQQSYNSTLTASVHDETSGDYRKMLLKIVEQSDIWSRP